MLTEVAQSYSTSRRNAFLNTIHQSPTKRSRTSKHLMALRTETPAHSDVEDLYWFALALTGDPDLAAKLVADAGKVTATRRGIFSH